MLSKLPHRIKLKNEVYEVVVVPRFDNEDDEGHCVYDKKTIKLVLTGRSDKTVVATLLHECLHYVSHVFDIGLTETQVSKLEIGLVELFKRNQTLSRLFFNTIVKRILKR